MSTRPEASRPRRILVIANETCAGARVVEEVSYRAGGRGGRVTVVAPALAKGRFEHWLVRDSERARSSAAERLEASLAALRAAGLDAEGRLGDADPLLALDDALRTEAPDEVVISTHPPSRSGWLERRVVQRARERYALPITHVVVDLEHETATAQSDRRAGLAAAAAPRPRVRVFHASGYDEAMRIRRDGFFDAPAPAGAGAGEGAGVWLVERPPADTDDLVLFAVDLPVDEAAPYELPSDGSDAGRRFLMPAGLLDRLGPPIAVGEWAE